MQRKFANPIFALELMPRSSKTTEVVFIDLASATTATLRKTMHAKSQRHRGT